MSSSSHQTTKSRGAAKGRAPTRATKARHTPAPKKGLSLSPPLRDFPRPPSATKHRAREVSARPKSNGISSLSRHEGNHSITIGSRGGVGQSIRVRGTEYIGSIVVGTGGDGPETIYAQRINQAGPTGTRLAQFASIYERWHPRVYSYRFTSSLPTTTPGTIVIAQDPDPLARYVSGASGNIARLRALPGSQMIQGWQNATATLASSRDYTSLWTIDPSPTVDEGDRLDLAGQVVIACAAHVAAAGTTLGILELDYDIEFYVSRLSSAAVERASVYLFGQAETNYFFKEATSSLFNNVFEYLKTAGSAFVESAFQRLLKAYIPVDIPTRKPKAVASRQQGFTPSILTFELTVAAGTPPAISHFFDIVSSSEAGTEFSQYSGITDALVSWNGPDGVLYPYATQYTMEYAVSGERGYVDFEFTSQDEWPETAVCFLKVYVAGSSVYTTITDGVVSTTARKHKSPAIVAPEPAGDGKEPLEFEEPSPPSHRAYPTVAPGGGLYVLPTPRPTKVGSSLAVTTSSSSTAATAGTSAPAKPK